MSFAIRANLLIDILNENISDKADAILRTHELDETTRRVLLEWLNHFDNSWMQSKFIQGYGVSSKIVGGVNTREPCLKVYVTKKLPDTEVDIRIPKTIQVPILGTFKTDVVEVGIIGPELGNARMRPLEIGCSISHADGQPGTLGCFVTAKNDVNRGVLMLSNMHVLANFGTAKRGDLICQPAVADGGSPNEDAVAVFIRSYPLMYEGDLSNEIDAAVASLQSAVEFVSGCSIHNCMETEQGSVPQEGDTVHIIGRSSGRSEAKVLDTHYRFRMKLRSPEDLSKSVYVNFRNQILCDSYSEYGDSGALVFDKNNRAVGLHMAGSPLVSVFNKIDRVLDLLNVELLA